MKPLFLQLFLPISIIVAAILISGTILYTQISGDSSDNLAQINQPTPTPANQVLPTDRIIGDSKAPVTIFEYSDFQCPFCRVFWQNSYAEIKKDYLDTGKAKIVFRHFPLENIHPMALPSAKAVECAADQGKFEFMHDKIFAEQAKLGENTIQYAVADLKYWAKAIGLKSDDFDRCLDSEKYSQKIASDQDLASQADVSGTPTFFIGGQKLVGAQQYSAFKAAIEEALK